MRCPAVFTCVVAVVSILGSGGLKLTGAEAPPSGGPSPKAEETNAQETLRSYIQLQEQLHATQLAIEQTRKENAEAAARNAEALAARLQTIEGALSTQRARELDAMQSSNRVMLIMAGTFAFVGIAAMLLMAFFQWRTVQGLAALSAAFPSIRSLGAGSPVAALGTGDLPLARAGQVEQSSSRLIGALEQLEKRIHQLEHASRPALREGGSDLGSGTSVEQGPHGDGGSADRLARHADDRSKPESDGQDHLKRLLGTGQALLDQDKPDRALACFQEVLAINPRHGEALVKKGTALERLQKLDEAIACYDEAIAADGSLTIAYLHKGGLFNRLERFGEALECYERALRTQETRAA